MQISSLAACFIIDEVSGINISISMEKPSLSTCLVASPFTDEDSSILPFLDTETLFHSAISLTFIDCIIVFGGR